MIRSSEARPERAGAPERARAREAGTSSTRLRARFGVVAAIVPLAFGAHGCKARKYNSGTRLRAAFESLTPGNVVDFLQTGSGDATYGGSIKFSWEVDAEAMPTRVAYHPASFRHHWQFLSTTPELAGLDSRRIDAFAVARKGRRVLLGTALVKGARSAPPFQADVRLVSSDPLTAAEVSRAFELLRRSSEGVLGEIDYLPAPEQRPHVAANAKSFSDAGIRVSESRARAEKECYASGWTVGRVKILRAADLPAQIEAGAITPDDILVLDQTPRGLPLVAGVVVGAESAPSSHVALLSRMAGAPFLFEKDAHASSEWKRLVSEGEPVFLSVQGEAGSVCSVLLRGGTSLTAAEASTLASLKRPVPLKFPPLDGSVRGIVPLAGLRMHDAAKVGAKAANVAELGFVIPGNSVDAGLAGGVGLYHRFLDEAVDEVTGKSVRAAITPRIASLAGAPLATVVKELDAIRKAIAKARMPDPLRAELLGALATVFKAPTRIRIRSSGNVEDHPEFSGAGLYESTGACYGDDLLPGGAASACDQGREPDPVLRGLQKVWSSLYTLKGHLARRHHGIDESAIGMGVLLQPAYKGELANGVVVTRYEKWGAPDASRDIVALVTGFPGEDDAETSPSPGLVPETSVVKSAWTRLLVPSSGIPQGRTLLAPEEYAQLHALVAKVHQRLAKDLRPSPLFGFELDFEWKLVADADGKRRIVLKQVRPVPWLQASSTLRGRGTFYVGERSMSLCPASEESGDGLAKIAHAFRFDVDARLLEIPLGTFSDLASPIESISVETLPGKKESVRLESRAAVLAATDWRGTRDGVESREVHMGVALSHPLLPQGSRLAWTTVQKRREDDKALPLEAVTSFAQAPFHIESPLGRLSFVAVERGTSCDGDSWGGAQAKVLGGWGDSRLGRTMKRLATTFPAAAGPVSIEFVASTSDAPQSAFEKTLFAGIDRFVIRGLLPRELVVARPLRAVYAPAHHNGSWSIAVDLEAAEGLTETERGVLRARGMRYLVAPDTRLPAVPGDFANPMHDIAIFSSEGKPFVPSPGKTKGRFP